MKLAQKIFASTFLLATFFTFSMPLVAAADNAYPGLVKCDGVVDTTKPGQKECNFSSLLGPDGVLATTINWLFFISLPIAVALFAYAGILYMTGIKKNIDKAKGIFEKAAVGFIIMLVAFTVVHTLISWVGNPSFGADQLLGT